MATAVADYIPLLSPDGSTLFDEYINGLVQGGAWTASPSQIAHVLTYSFNINDDGTYPDGAPAPGAGGTWGASPAMATAVQQALAAWSNVANLTFQQVTSGTYYFQSTADLAFTLTGNDFASYGLALGFFPDPAYADSVLGEFYTEAQYPNPEGDIFFDNYNSAFSLLDPGGMGLTVILHEIGHALGLKHPGDDGGNFKPSFGELGIGIYNSMQYTLMSEDIGLLTPSVSGFAATPMPLDILAIQRIYGANMSYNTGDNVYTLASDGVLKTIWDAGGTDTFNASGLAIAVSIDLNPGAFSVHGPNVGPFGNRTAIAYNVTIENATGGSGNDTITGNAAANDLSGGIGNDTIRGGAGDDTVAGGNNNDRLNGESGADLLDGGPGNDTIGGDKGDDSLDGGAGSDAVTGGQGSDSYVVDDPGDTVWEVLTPSIIVASTNGAGDQADAASFVPSVSSDGRYVAFLSNAGNLAGAGDFYLPDLFVKDMQSGQVTRVAATWGVGGDLGAGGCQAPSISDDGRYVAFQFQGDLSNPQGIFIKDLLTGTFTPVSTASEPNPAPLGEEAYSPKISADGRYVAFHGGSNILTGDATYISGVFVKDILTGTGYLASAAADGTPGNASGFDATISADGRYVAYSSHSTNLVTGDTNGYVDVFVKDLQTGAVTRVSTAADGTQGIVDSTDAAVSADGRYVAFESKAVNLVPVDTNNFFSDILVKDLLTGAVTIASTASDGTQRFGDSVNPTISGDGRFVTFESYANFVAGDTNGVEDVFLKDLLTGELRRVSVALNGAEASSLSGDSVISAEGLYVAFTSNSLVPGDANGAADIYLYSNSMADMGGVDSISASVDYALPANVELLTLSGSGAINGTGNGLDNLIFGNGAGNALNGGAGADTLTGGGGIDSLVGGGGNDTHIATATGTVGASRIVFVQDAVNEATDAGLDLVFSTSSYTLPDNTENLVLTGAPMWRAYTGTGNALDNMITGQGAARHQLYGNGGDDTLTGGSGADTLAGGSGADTLSGGSGADVFLFDTTPSADSVLDFTSGADHINLENAIYTAFGTPGAVNTLSVQTGLESAITATSGNAGDGQDYLKYATDTGHLYYDADGTGVGGLSLIATIFSNGTTPAALLPAQDILIV